MLYDEIKFCRISRTIVASNRVSCRVIMSFPLKHKILGALFSNNGYLKLFTVKMYIFLFKETWNLFFRLKNYAIVKRNINGMEVYWWRNFKNCNVSLLYLRTLHKLHKKRRPTYTLGHCTRYTKMQTKIKYSIPKPICSNV